MHAQLASNAASDIGIAGRILSRDLGRPAASSMVAISSLHKKAAGEILFAEGDEADSVYEVVRGMLRTYKLLPDGRRQVTGFLSAGDLLGCVSEGVCIYSAEAITEVALCRYKRSVFERLIDEVPGLAKRLLAVTSLELRAAQEQLLLLGRKSATEKVASFLQSMAARQGDSESDLVELPMTRGDIADYLGLTVETVSRTLSKMKQEGLIALKTATRIEIRDAERLGDLAAGEEALDV